MKLIIDLDDNMLRRMKGDKDYNERLARDDLPKGRRGPIKDLSRRDQKAQLATLLFKEEEQDEDKGPSEVYYHSKSPQIADDSKTRQHKMQRLKQAMMALRLSIMLRSAGCASLSLAELCKRRMQFDQRLSVAALRAAKLSLDIAGENEWDPDLVVLEAENEYNPDMNDKDSLGADIELSKLGANRVENLSEYGLSHPSNLRYVNGRVSSLCKRSGLLQMGNALQSLERFEEARSCYQETLEILSGEIRTARTDWERHSLLLNIGNTHLSSGDVEVARSYYKKAEELGKEHIDDKNGSDVEGNNMISSALRHFALAAKVSGDVEGAKKIMSQVIERSEKIGKEEPVRVE